MDTTKNKDHSVGLTRIYTADLRFINEQSKYGEDNKAVIHRLLKELRKKRR
ncbi:hypothetical protein [Candidatus Magnetobacterium casense]|uniref:Uncharacterized protein n=1 Tax=Candidatus Magnetobacterium casense TaxID=1455061 RepID=A0ABS6RV70_9BACT|nr:hypothetical protein [Candidatus Magnetobacterium casensis]MBV6340342.1 hypothetical protein [Candidatus Magnetobacterium casensis]